MGRRAAGAARTTVAASAADVAAHFEAIGAHLPPETWRWLDAQAAQERNAA